MLSGQIEATGADQRAGFLQRRFNRYDSAALLVGHFLILRTDSPDVAWAAFTWYL
jgi:hypothetical protein